MLFIETENSYHKMQTNNTNVKIKLNHLLWRSRSKCQDYQFINTPKSPSIDGWFSVFTRVFSRHEPGMDTKNITGQLVVPGSERESEFFQFIASYFIDDEYLDSGGRPIQQYLIWFYQDYDISEIDKLLSNDWGKEFISSFREAYFSFYESSDTSKMAEKEYIVIKSSNVNSQNLDFEDMGKIEYGSPAAAHLPTPSLYNKIIVILKKLLKM